MSKQIKPLDDNVLVELVVWDKNRRESGIMLSTDGIPERHEKHHRVIDFGDDVEGIEKGQYVICEDYAETKFQLDFNGKEYALLPVEKIIATIEN